MPPFDPGLTSVREAASKAGCEPLDDFGPDPRVRMTLNENAEMLRTNTGLACILDNRTLRVPDCVNKGFDRPRRWDVVGGIVALFGLDAKTRGNEILGIMISFNVTAGHPSWLRRRIDSSMSAGVPSLAPAHAAPRPN